MQTMTTVTTPDLPRYSHPWRTPRGRSFIDTAFKFVLYAIALSLPAEGLIDLAGRTPTFFLSIVAAGIALFRLPGILKNVGKSKGMLLVMFAFFFAIALYFYNPIREHNEIVPMIQRIILTCLFLYFADLGSFRQRTIELYWYGWLLLVTYSVIQVLAGNVRSITLLEDVTRIYVPGYSLGEHSAQVVTGLVLSFPMLFRPQTPPKRALLLVGLALGSLSMFISANRSGFLGLLAALALWLVLRGFVRRSLSQTLVSRAVTLVLMIIGVYVAFTQTSFGPEMLDTMFIRLNQTFVEGRTSRRDELFIIGLDLATRNPIGIGYGNSMGMVAQYQGVEMDIHNQYLRMLIDGGIVGFLIFGTGVGLIVKNGWDWYRASGDDYFFPMIFLLLFAATVAGFHYKITWFFLGMNAITPLQAGRAPAPARPPDVPAAQSLGATGP